MGDKRPEIEWCPSPNFKEADGREISCLVIHATASTGAEGSLSWLCDKASKVSAHYLIDQFGKVYQLVRENNIAYHAGISEWGGKSQVNGFSIGIELVNPNDGKTKYPQAQIDALLALSVPICKEHAIKLANVVRHRDIAPLRKNDPLGFPWDDFKIDLFKAGIV